MSMQLYADSTQLYTKNRRTQYEYASVAYRTQFWCERGLSHNLVYLLG